MAEGMKRKVTSRNGNYVFPQLDVHVREKHIQQGIPRNSGYCMVSEAIKESIYDKYGEIPARVSTDLQTIRFTMPSRDLRYIYFTPASVQSALVKFDQGEEPDPFTFRLKTIAGGQIVPVVHRDPSTKSKTKTKVTITENNGDGAVMVKKTFQGGKYREVPIVVGGREPPRFSKRRVFGLKNFKP